MLLYFNKDGIIVSDEEIERRKEELEMIARKIQDSKIQMSDIRERDWKNINCNAAKILNLLIETENLFIDLDEYQMENDQCYPEIEDIMLLIGDIRERYTNFVDNHLEVLEINKK